MSAVKLYGYWRSSSTWRVRIALAHKGIEHETVPVHLVRDGGEQHADWFHELNPADQVPVLQFADGQSTRRIGQSLAILAYLEEAYPSPSFLPADPYLRARARQLAELVNSGIQPLQNLAVIQKLKAMELDAGAWCRDWIDRGLHSYEELLGESAGSYSVGDEPSWADALLIPQLYNARRFHLDLEPFPRIRAVEEACLALPAFRDTRPDAQPDAE